MFSSGVSLQDLWFALQMAKDRLIDAGNDLEHAVEVGDVVEAIKPEAGEQIAAVVAMIEVLNTLAQREPFNSILKLCRDNNREELEVISGIAKGVVHGRKKYGELAINLEDKDMLLEAVEELRDAAVYFGAEAIKLKKEREIVAAADAKLLEFLETLRDVRLATEALEESEERIPWDEVKEQLDKE